MSDPRKDVPIHVLREAAWNLFNLWDPSGELLKKCAEGFEPDETDDSGAVDDGSESTNQEHGPQSVNSPQMLTRAQKHRLAMEQTFNAAVATSQGPTAVQRIASGPSAGSELSRRQSTKLEEPARYDFRRPKKPRLQEKRSVIAHKAVAPAVAAEFSESPQGLPTERPTDRSECEPLANNHSDNAGLGGGITPCKVPVGGSAPSLELVQAKDPQLTLEESSTPNPALIDVIAEQLLQSDDYDVQIIDAQVPERAIVTTSRANHLDGGSAAAAPHVDSPRGRLTDNEPDPSACNHAEDGIFDEVSQCLEILLERATQANDLSSNTVSLKSAETFPTPSQNSTDTGTEQVQQAHLSYAEDIPRRVSPQTQALPTVGLSIDALDDDAEIELMLQEKRDEQHRCAERFSELQRFINELRELNLRNRKTYAKRTSLLSSPVDIHGADAPILATRYPTSNGSTTSQMFQPDVGNLQTSHGSQCEQAVITTKHHTHEDGAGSSVMQPSEATPDSVTSTDDGQAPGTHDIVAYLALDVKHHPLPQNASEEELLQYVLKARSLADKYVEELKVLQKNLEKKAENAKEADGSNNAYSSSS